MSKYLRKVPKSATLCKILLLLKDNQYKKGEDWVFSLLAKGQYAFSIAAIRKEFSNHSKEAIKSTLKRLVDKSLIVSIHKGYYLIIPPQYKSKGVLPLTLYLDDFMKELNRPYYLGLLNAAAFYGAAHQQPQEYYVVTNFPVLRPTHKKGVKVNYISKQIVPDNFLEDRKIESGYIKISMPILTAIDLVQFSKRVGGLNRVATILFELIETINPDTINDNLLNHAPVTAFQRLGYLFDKTFNNQPLAEIIFKMLKESSIELYRTPLKITASTKGCPVDEKWRVVVNTTIDIDL